MARKPSGFEAGVSGESPFARTAMLLGEAGLDRLAKACVAVFGLGGVGSYAAEALARCGVGRFLLVDADVVGPSNLNRQLVALQSTLGQPKAEVMRLRILDIQPGADVEILRLFYRPEAAEAVAWSGLDGIADAMDTVRAKVDLAVRAQRLGIPLVSCMGAGNRLDPTQFAVGDLFSTDGCPLCRAMRKKLRRQGVASLQVVYSREPPRAVPVLHARDEHSTARRPTPASISFVPAVAGMILASEVVRILLGGEPRRREEDGALARQEP